MPVLSNSGPRLFFGLLASYKMEASRNPKDRTSGYQYTFTVGKTGQTPTTMQPASNNAYGIADHVLKQIQEEARRTLLFEQMSDKFGPMMDLVKDLDSRVKKIETYLKEDLDGDGMPDFLEGISKIGDVAKAGNEMKKVFTGGTLFG